jgi:RNA polymerase sigma factor (sigma-70 family)
MRRLPRSSSSSLLAFEAAGLNNALDSCHPCVSYEQLLLEHLDLVDQVVRGIARRHRLSADETEELQAAIRLKLLENDYDVLRRFQRRCSLRTYLTAVVHRFFLDQRNAKWGKWRPSLEARRQGPVAMLLERLLTRDGLSFDQAVEVMRTNHEVEESSDELHRLSLVFPTRMRRHFVGEDALRNAASEARAEADLEQGERERRASATSAALAAALNELGPQDRVILKMRFQDNFQVAQIARLLRVEAKPLYRRLEQIMKVLRQAMEAQGISPEDVEAITGGPAAEVQSVMGAEAAGKPVARPSVR